MGGLARVAMCPFMSPFLFPLKTRVFPCFFYVFLTLKDLKMLSRSELVKKHSFALVQGANIWRNSCVLQIFTVSMPVESL